MFYISTIGHLSMQSLVYWFHLVPLSETYHPIHVNLWFYRRPPSTTYQYNPGFYHVPPLSPLTYQWNQSLIIDYIIGFIMCNLSLQPLVLPCANWSIGSTTFHLPIYGSYHAPPIMDIHGSTCATYHCHQWLSNLPPVTVMQSLVLPWAIRWIL